MKYKMMKVFNWLDMPDDVQNECGDDQSIDKYKIKNDSFCSIWLDNINRFPKTIKWLLANGATKEDGKVLVLICW